MTARVARLFSPPTSPQNDSSSPLPVSSVSPAMWDHFAASNQAAYARRRFLAAVDGRLRAGPRRRSDQEVVRFAGRLDREVAQAVLSAVRAGSAVPDRHGRRSADGGGA